MAISDECECLLHSQGFRMMCFKVCIGVMKCEPCMSTELEGVVFTISVID